MRPFYRAGQYGMGNSVGYLVRRTANLVLPQFEALFADQDLTFSQWTVLMALREWGQTTAAELARHICHDAGSLTRILDELESRGLIARSRSASDRRQVALTLLPRGQALVVNLVPRVVDFWNHLLDGFSHAEIRVLIKLLTRLAAAAEGRREGQREDKARARRGDHGRPHRRAGEEHVPRPRRQRRP